MSDYHRTDYARSEHRPWKRGLILSAIAFVAGLIAMGWVLTRWEAAAPYLSWMHPASNSQTSGTPASPPATPQPLAPTDAVERRVNDLESRIERIARRAEAASGNADRAEGLLVAFAARRAVDRGLQLGYVEGLLRERFSRDHPQAVAVIISSAAKPVTLEDLRSDLDMIAPELTGPGPKASWWASVQRELAGMIVVRRADLPSGTPDDRIARARRNLQTDHVDRALAEIARLPARDKTGPWMDKARRYIAAHNALDLIEAAALLGPADAPPPDAAEPAAL